VSSRAPCSVLNEKVPLAGTAPTSDSWLIVMHQGPWGERPLDTLVSRDLTIWANEHDAKILLARTPKGVDPYPLSTFLCSSRSSGLVVGTLNSQGIPNLATTRPSSPMLLICTNGKRDACCATFGRNLITESKKLLSPSLFGQILECSHIGGHRFAPTAIWLPENLVLGRLEPHAVTGLMEHGGIGSQFIRGNTNLTPAQQVVHASVWPQTIVFESDERLGTVHYITTFINGATKVFTVAATIVEVVESCGGASKSNTQYQLQGPV
jgi:hypothetical protein